MRIRQPSGSKAKKLTVEEKKAFNLRLHKENYLSVRFYGCVTNCPQPASWLTTQTLILT